MDNELLEVIEQTKQAYFFAANKEEEVLALKTGLANIEAKLKAKEINTEAPKV